MPHNFLELSLNIFLFASSSAILQFPLRRFRQPKRTSKLPSPQYTCVWVNYDVLFYILKYIISLTTRIERPFLKLLNIFRKSFIKQQICRKKNVSDVIFYGWGDVKFIDYFCVLIKIILNIVFYLMKYLLLNVGWFRLEMFTLCTSFSHFLILTCSCFTNINHNDL